MKAAYTPTEGFEEKGCGSAHDNANKRGNDEPFEQASKENRLLDQFLCMKMPWLLTSIETQAHFKFKILKGKVSRSILVCKADYGIIKAAENKPRK